MMPTRSGSTCGSVFRNSTRRHHVVDLLAAVVDRLVVRLAVAGAAAVVGGDDHVAARDRLLHEREHGDAPVAVHAAVHPDHRRVALRPALLERLEQVGRDVHVADAAAVLHHREVDDALAELGIPGGRPSRARRCRPGSRCRATGAPGPSTRRAGGRARGPSGPAPGGSGAAAAPGRLALRGTLRRRLRLARASARLPERQPRPGRRTTTSDRTGTRRPPGDRAIGGLRERSRERGTEPARRTWRRG